MAKFGSVKEFKPDELPSITRQLTGDALLSEKIATSTSSLNIEVAEVEVTRQSDWVDIAIGADFSPAAGEVSRFRRLDDGRVEVVIAAEVAVSGSNILLGSVPSMLVPLGTVAMSAATSPDAQVSCVLDCTGAITVRSAAPLPVGYVVYVSVTYTPKMGLDTGYRTGFPIEIPVKMKQSPKAVFASNGCYGLKWEWNGRLRILDASGLPPQKKVKLQVVLLGE